VTLCVGIDHVEIRRVAKAMRNPRFLPRFFGEQERAQLQKRGNPPASVAANFCAKEALGKALGCGLGGFELRDVQLLRHKSGRPYLALTGKAAELAQRNGLSFEVSVSHDKIYALAQVVGYSVDS